MTAEEFYKEELEGEPLTHESVIWGLQAYADEQEMNHLSLIGELINKIDCLKEVNKKCKHNWQYVDNFSDRMVCTKCGKRV